MKPNDWQKWEQDQLARLEQKRMWQASEPLPIAWWEWAGLLALPALVVGLITALLWVK